MAFLQRIMGLFVVVVYLRDAEVLLCMKSGP